MGLSGAKKRTKISNDPNNNAWSSSTERFGHRMLTSQGWTPGSYLGAKDAAHSEHFTAANASHIRILLKDDNLGLGAKRGAKAETFGLSTLQGIFGRLNGKSDTELATEEKTRRDADLVVYQGQRWGHVQFISGGFLVGDSMEERKAAKKGRGDSQKSPGAEGDHNVAKSSKKRKRAEMSGVDTTSSQNLSKRVTDARSEDVLEETAASVSSSAEEDVSEGASAGTEKTRERAEKRKRKEERRKRREDKQQRKLARQAKREAKASAKQKDGPGKSQEVAAHEDKQADLVQDTVVVDAPTSVQTTSTPFGRHAVRSRYIRQKRMALTDAKALNEILMIKA